MEILHILNLQRKQYRFIGKYINGVSKQEIAPVLEKFEKMENDNNRIFPIIEQRIFPFLLANGIEPIIISGSPQEPLEIYKKRMNFEKVYAIQYEMKDGRYTDNCIINTAIADGKTKIIQEFLKNNPNAKIVFAFGDSEADIPMLELANQGFMNNYDKLLDKDNIHYLDFKSEKSGEQIIEIMVQELEKLNMEKYEEVR